MTEELTPELLIRAYTLGVFPMGEGAAIQWYSPDPRCIINLDSFHIPKRLLRTYRQDKFEIRINSCWHEVISACAGRKDTWITAQIIRSYTQLHQMGLAHSVETFSNNTLVGGLYGVALGGAFMGESMFHKVPNASKIALIYLAKRLKKKGFSLLDCQFMTEHLQTFGAVNIDQKEYLRRLAKALTLNCTFV